jgi:choline-glycine betaine transporter
MQRRLQTPTVNYKPLLNKGQTTSHGFAVDLLAICWRLAGDATDLSTASLQQVASML